MSVLLLGSISCIAEPTLAIEEDAIAGHELRPMLRTKRLAFSASRIEATRGEDGRGGTIAASDPVALDVTAESFGARAVDPVLHVGDVRFVHYAFPSKGVMRFVAADAALLVPGSEVSLRWGDERVVLTRSLQVPE